MNHSRRIKRRNKRSESRSLVRCPRRRRPAKSRNATNRTAKNDRMRRYGNGRTRGESGGKPLRFAKNRRGDAGKNEREKVVGGVSKLGANGRRTGVAGRHFEDARAVERSRAEIAETETNKVFVAEYIGGLDIAMAPTSVMNSTESVGNVADKDETGAGAEGGTNTPAAVPDISATPEREDGKISADAERKQYVRRARSRECG